MLKSLFKFGLFVFLGVCAGLGFDSTFAQLVNAQDSQPGSSDSVQATLIAQEVVIEEEILEEEFEIEGDGEDLDEEFEEEIEEFEEVIEEGV